MFIVGFERVEPFISAPFFANLNVVVENTTSAMSLCDITEQHIAALQSWMRGDATIAELKLYSELLNDYDVIRHGYEGLVTHCLIRERLQWTIREWKLMLVTVTNGIPAVYHEHIYTAMDRLMPKEKDAVMTTYYMNTCTGNILLRTLCVLPAGDPVELYKSTAYVYEYGSKARGQIEYAAKMRPKSKQPELPTTTPSPKKIAPAQID